MQFIFNAPFPSNRKTASLGEMIQQLSAIGVTVPGGFAVTSAAYDAILDRFQLRERLKLLLDGVDVTNLDDLSERGFQARQMVLNAGLPEAVKDQVIASYKALSEDGEKVSVAVRSSATAEDLPTASFAGQQVRREAATALYQLLSSKAYTYAYCHNQ